MDQNNEVLHLSSGMAAGLQHENTPGPNPALGAGEAIEAAAGALGMDHTPSPGLIEKEGPHRYRFSKGNVSREEIPAELVYWATPEKQLVLAWSLSIYEKKAEHWWHLIVDANTGALIKKYDWVKQCQAAPANPRHRHHNKAPASVPAAVPSSAEAAYRVYEFPLESPSHGPRTLAEDPADAVASPFGWHDMDGAEGAEYTITRGNNAYAFEDRNDIDVPGFSPDGGPALLLELSRIHISRC
jgi:hypothetical protein